ncbi:MAG: hypothetical protein EWV84_16740 [Microcystis sp. M_QC_C_20170808_M3Col]|nr:MAG: hypothetical protein EWV84_16740 [Microcystis sp. M_QC_C_20170808_M3Col]
MSTLGSPCSQSLARLSFNLSTFCPFLGKVGKWVILSSYLDFTTCIEQFSPHPAPSEDGVLIETDAFHSTAIGTGGDKIENSRP